MFRSAARLLALLVLLSPAFLAAEATSSAQATGVEMTPPVRRALKQVEEQWLQWIVQNDPQSSASVANDLVATARQLGMTRLPDLASGALAKGLQAARQKDFRRARAALAAAEKLDPGRSDTAFAEAAVNRLEGDWPGAAGASLRGYGRLFGMATERYLWFQSLLIWGLALLLLTGALLVAVQMAAKGGALYKDLAGFFGRWLPGPAVAVVVAALLLWPLALPSGLLWLPVYWSLLLWGYATRSERFVLAALWLLLGLAPVLIDEQRRHVSVALSPPVQAMESLQQHRLYGSLFMDLGSLRALLPDSAAVRHLLADVHRSLNQWDLARSLYRQVLEKEPENTAAMMNLGAYFFLKGDFGNAIQNFQQVVTTDPQNAAAHFNLSQAYSESYLFDESKRALALAREIDDTRVNFWLRNVNQQRVVTSSAGLNRIPEIRGQLRETWGTREGENPRLEMIRRWLPLLASVVLLLLAVALHLARRPFGYGETKPPAGSAGSWWRVLLPGFGSSEEGEGGRAYLALLVPVALLLLPFFRRLGYRIPWGYDPGNLTAWIVAVLGLLIYFLLRMRWHRQNQV